MKHGTIAAIAETLAPIIGENVKRFEKQEAVISARVLDIEQRLEGLVQQLEDKNQVLILRINELEQRLEAVAEVEPDVMQHVGALTDRIEALEQREAIPGPQGEPGKDGRDGIDGKDGAPGNAGLDGKNGDPGRDGLDGAPGKDGQEGAPGINGKDGTGLAGALIDREGHLIVTLTDGSTHKLGAVIGRDGIPGAPGENGKDGRDGFSLDHFSAEMLPDGKTARLIFKSGDVEQTHDLFFPLLTDKGVWKAETEYVKGDTVTFGGSLFIAQESTSGKPEIDKSWRLAVKRGRDGKDGKDGKAGERGPAGKDGQWR